ncbi:MAG: hypothetical protein AAFX85_19315, partial [Pseudomonadota bacterium]
MNNKMTLRTTFLATLALLGASFGAHAAEHQVAAQGVKFAPLITYIAPGDSITWTGMIGHNIE